MKSPLITKVIYMESREASDRELEMVRLVTWWRCSNLIMLVTLRKGNHPSEA